MYESQNSCKNVRPNDRFCGCAPLYLLKKNLYQAQDERN